LPDGLSYPPGAYKYSDDLSDRVDELYLVSQDVLHVVDLEHGFVLWKLKLPFAAASAPAGNISHVYVGAWNDRIYAISKMAKTVGWSYRASAPVTAAAEVTERSVESVFIGGEDGIVYSMNPVFQERKWHFRTQGTITASPLFHRNFVYVASRDMNLYCIGSVNGNLAWKYAAGAPLSTEPCAFDRHLIYCVADDHRLLAVNLQPEAAGGQYLRWQCQDVNAVLAQGRGRVFVRERSGAVISLDEKDGRTSWQQPLAVGADFHALNKYSRNSRRKRERSLASIMVFGYKDGWLIAIGEKGEY
ncbi:PQQ-binding-like beta-propeller repeat protein, partial [Planctomycetota bacterium]